MKKIVKYLWFISLIIFAIAVKSSLPEDDTEKIMPFVKSIKNHDRKSLASGKDVLTDSLCVTCHYSIGQNHHVFGVRMKHKPEGVILSESERIMCITCHDLSKVRYDSRPWKSMSLFDSLFSSEKKFKTYYLIMNNNNGELCITCHSVEEKKY
jgi:hypothetical protein